MKLIRTADGKKKLRITHKEWETLGDQQGWIEDNILDDIHSAAEKSIWRVAKKKGKKVNPWAVCNKSVGKKENPEKFERCVMDVKAKHPIKKD